MSYATSAQIASEAKLAKADFGSDTMPTKAKVEEIIAEVEAEFDAKVGRKYTVPLTSSAGILIARSIVIALVVERVREIMEVKTGTEKEEQDPAAKTASGARKRLDQIVSGDLPLSGESLLSSSDGVRSYAVDNGTEPVLRKGCDQW